MENCEFANRIFHGDCLPIMQKMNADSVDMVLTSQPYDNLRAYNGFIFPFQNISEQYCELAKTRLEIQFEAPPNKNQRNVHAQGDLLFQMS